MFDSLQIGSASPIIPTIIQNGVNTNGADDESMDVESDTIWMDERNQPPINRTKLQTPTFVLKKLPARDVWQTIEKSTSINTKLGIETICPNVCFHFLRDECVEGENCYYSHEFPDDTNVSQALITCGTENAAKLFHIIVARCPKVLHRFFSTFIAYFVEHNSKTDLIDAIAICERERDNRQFTLFQHLITGLMSIGETYITSMEIILTNLQYSNSDIVDTLLNINLVKGVNVSEFLSVFYSLNEKHYPFNRKMIDRLIYICTQSESVCPADQLKEFVRLIFEILRSNKKSDLKNSLNKVWYKRYLLLYQRFFKYH